MSFPELPRMTANWPNADQLPALRDAFRKAVLAGKDARAEWQAWSAAFAEYEDAHSAERSRCSREAQRLEQECGEINNERRNLADDAKRVGQWQAAPSYLGAQPAMTTAEDHDAAVQAWRDRLVAYAGAEYADADLETVTVPLPPRRPVSQALDRRHEPRAYSVEQDAALDASVAT